MPRYDYACAACGRRFEVIHGINDDGPTSCPLCGEGPVRKAFAAPAIHFKGSGWAKKERRATAAPKSGSDGSGEGSSASDGGDATPAATPKASTPSTKDASPVSGSTGD